MNYMRKIILLVLACCIYTYSNAQRHTTKDDKLDKEVLRVTIGGDEMLTLEMQKELNLTHEQYEQVKIVNQFRYNQLIEAEEIYKDNDLQRSKTAYLINMEADKAMSALLDQSQLRIFLELENSSQGRLMSGKSEE